MEKAINFSREYLADRNNYDLYLTVSAKAIRNCIEGFKYYLTRFDSRVYYINMMEFINLVPPKELEVIHFIILNRLRNLYKEIGNLEMYIENKNYKSIEMKSKQLRNMVVDIIGGYYALIKTICNCEAGDTSYVSIIKRNFPEMYVFN